MADDVGLRDAEFRKEKPEVMGQFGDRVASLRLVGMPMPAQIRCDEPQAGRKVGRNQAPAARAVGKAMQEQNGRSAPVAQLDIGETDTVRQQAALLRQGEIALGQRFHR